MGLRVKENGGSESRLSNGVDRDGVTRQHHPTRKRADFRLVFHHEKA